MSSGYLRTKINTALDKHERSYWVGAKDEDVQNILIEELTEIIRAEVKLEKKLI